MPFTPFHMGPGTAIKAVSGKCFSLTVFGFSQVVIDIEPLIRILRGDSILHGFTHTYIGAVLIGIISLVVGKPFCEKFLQTWNIVFNAKYLLWLKLTPDITWIASISVAFIGTFSHVLLDSIMHSDMHPLAPLSSSNEIFQLMPVGWLHLFCVFLAIAGGMVILLVGAWNKWSIDITQ